MAPEVKMKEKREEVKLSCFFDKRVKPRNLEKVEQIERNKTNHTTKLGIAGSLLERRSRGVTTLHHYERISSRDLEWHRRENGREREEVKN